MKYVSAKKKILKAFILAALIVISVSACSNGQLHDSDDAAGNQQQAIIDKAEAERGDPVNIETPVYEISDDINSETEPEDMELDFSVEHVSLAPWQTAYIALLQQICDEEAPIRDTENYGDIDNLSDSYGLYDVDKDGIPELFVKYGNSEAAYMGDAYTYRDNTVAGIGQLGLGHVSLYSWPGENAALFVWAHMGNQMMQKLTMQDGCLVLLGGVLLDEDLEGPEDAYTPAGAVVPGAKYIDMVRTTLFLPTNTPLTLPIYEYGLSGGSYPTGNSSREAREAIGDVLSGTGKLYGVSGDGFGGDAGWVSFEEYCGPGVLNEYARYPMIPRSFAWLDINQDGQEECVLYLEEDDNAEYPGKLNVVLSYQDNIVYAYALNYVYDYSLGQNGVFYNDNYLWAVRWSFYKNQCYRVETEYDSTIKRVSQEPYSKMQ